MNSLNQGHAGTAPETSRNALSTSQGTNEDNSQIAPHPEAGILLNQMAQNSGPEDGHDTLRKRVEKKSSFGLLRVKTDAITASWLLAQDALGSILLVVVLFDLRLSAKDELMGQLLPSIPPVSFSSNALKMFSSPILRV